MTFGLAIARILFPASFLIVPASIALDDATALEAAGVKHALAVSIGADPKMTGARGGLTLVVRVSAHAQNANFAGEIPVAFEDTDLSAQTPFREIWSEKTCHERRGLPRIWVLRLTGTIAAGDDKTAIKAEMRQIGMLLPDDELRTEQRVAASNTTDSSERILQARTLKSHLLVQLKLTSTACAL
jgi:hypothetical protein